MPAPRIIHPRCVLHHVTGIDTSSQCWRGDVELELLLALPDSELPDRGAAFRQFVPNIDEAQPDHPVFALIPVEVLNAFDEDKKREVWLTPYTTSDKRVVAFSLSMRLQASFRQKFDLRDFPFDVQRLAVEMKLTAGVGTVTFSRDGLQALPVPLAAAAGGFDSQIRIQPEHCPVTTEWRVLDRVECLARHSQRQFSRSGTIYSMLAFRLTAQRRSLHTLLSAALPYALVTSAVLFVAAESVEEVGSRLGLLSGSLTASLAFSRYGGSSLPQVGYQTLLDRYISSCLVAIVCAGLVAAGVKPLTLFLQAVAPASVLVGVAVSEPSSLLLHALDRLLWVAWALAWAGLNAHYATQMWRCEAAQSAELAAWGEAGEPSAAAADDNAAATVTLMAGAATTLVNDASAPTPRRRARRASTAAP